MKLASSKKWQSQLFATSTVILWHNVCFVESFTLLEKPSSASSGLLSSELSSSCPFFYTVHFSTSFLPSFSSSWFFFFGLKLKLAQKRASLSLHPALYSFCCWPSKRLAITTDDILLPLVSSTPRLLTSPFPLFPIPTLRTTKRVTLRQKRSPHLLPSPLALVNT